MQLQVLLMWRDLFFGDWTNYQIDESGLYDGVDYLAYHGKGKHILLEEIK